MGLLFRGTARHGCHRLRGRRGTRCGRCRVPGRRHRRPRRSDSAARECQGHVVRRHTAQRRLLPGGGARHGSDGPDGARAIGLGPAGVPGLASTINSIALRPGVASSPICSDRRADCARVQRRHLGPPRLVRIGGQVNLDNPAIEGRDVSAIIDWLATQPGVELKGPNDPVVGMTGASYGGGLQLSAAAIDHRIDAIVPDMSWYSLIDSLYPNEVVKAGWGHILCAPATWGRALRAGGYELVHRGPAQRQCDPRRARVRRLGQPRTARRPDHDTDAAARRHRRHAVPDQRRHRRPTTPCAQQARR